MCHVNFFFFNGCALIPFFCVFVFFLQVKSYIDVLEFWKVKAYFVAYFGHDAVLLPVYWAGQKKRNLVQGRGKITV